MPKVSVVINVDSRPTFMDPVTRTAAVDGAVKSGGTRSVDYMVDGVENKLKFFDGFDTEVIVYCDIHEPLPDFAIGYLLDAQRAGRVHKLVLARHDETLDGTFFAFWNDITYLQALSQARGPIVAHFDGDTAVFRRDRALLDQWIGKLERGEAAYVCNPSPHSPGPVNDPNFDYRWASTRFFLCRRDSLDVSEILRCLRDSNYLYATYGDRKMKCPWLEHVLGLMARQEVWYPPMDVANMLVFCWSQYRRGTLAKLNEMSFDQVADFVRSCGGIQYPCDVFDR